MAKFFEKKAFFAIAPFKGSLEYDSLKNFAPEYGNRLIASIPNALAGTAAGALVTLPITVATKSKLPIFLGSILGGSIGSTIGDYRTLRKSERKSLGKEKTDVPKYIVRRIAENIGGFLIPIPVLGSATGDYLVSRKMF